MPESLADKLRSIGEESSFTALATLLEAADFVEQMEAVDHSGCEPRCQRIADLGPDDVVLTFGKRKGNATTLPERTAHNRTSEVEAGG